ncbi:MAG: hypothetical protein AAGJ52_13885 [Pseudomonadota bacterium]
MTLPWLDPIKSHISEVLSSERLGHAPLIQGPVGVGKRALSEWLVRRILCLEGVDGQPCGRCRACELLSKGTHPDFFDVGIPEEKREIPVDSIRDLTGRLQLTASISERRVGRVMPADAMNTNAANALLKTLEEPAANAWVMLVSDQPGRLPATIRSRCQVITVRPPDRLEALEWMSQNASEGDQALQHQALTLAGNAPLAALELLEGEGMQSGFAIREGLGGLAQGQAISQVLDETWTQTPTQTWRWLATWMDMVLRSSLEAGADQELAGSLPRGVSSVDAARLWESALQGTALSRGNARQDLLLGKWLLEWQQVCQNG